MKKPNCDLCGQPMKKTKEVKRYTNNRSGKKTGQYYYVRNFTCCLCDITVSEWPDDRIPESEPAFAIQEANEENQLQAKEPFD